MLALFSTIDQASFPDTYRKVTGVPWAAIGGGDFFEDAAVAVTFDGTLYNGRDLARELSLEPDNSARLIADLYERHGLDLFTRLNGPCAVCIVDKRQNTAHVATDRYGINPVVYLANGGRVICAPRIRDILALPSVDPGGIDPGALVDYLNFSAIPGPRTVYRNLRMLPPGHVMTVSGANTDPQLTCYYDLDYTIENAGEERYRALVPSAIEEAVRVILDTEAAAGRRVGTFLSGGTDSSTVTGMVKKLAGSVKSFSIGFDEPGYNELDYARIAARHFGAEHHEYMVTPNDVLAAIDALLDVYDEPFGNASAIPSYFCARFARDHGVDTMLAGDGGDEIFGGNERYAAGRVFSAYHQVPKLLRKGLIEPLLALAPAVHPVIGKGQKYIRRANIPQPDRFYSYNPVAALGVDAIFSPDFVRQLGGHDTNAWARELWNAAGTDDELNRLLYLDMKHTVTDNDLRKVNGMTAKAGMRVAYPFLDHRLVDLAGRMPSDLKVRGTYLRYIFKESLKGFLPPEVIAKQKHGFGLPIGVWVRTKGNITEFVRDALLGPSCSIRPWLRDGFLEDIFRIHGETGASFYGDIIWNLLMMELWNMRTANTDHHQRRTHAD